MPHEPFLADACCGPTEADALAGGDRAPVAERLEATMFDLRDRLAGIEQAWRALFGVVEARPHLRYVRGGQTLLPQARP